MTFFTKTMAAMAACASLIAAVPAQAHSWDHGGQWGSWSGDHHRSYGYRNFGGYGGYSFGFPYRSYRYYRHDDGAALVVGGLIGVALGAAIASSNRDRDYYGDRYDRYRGYNGYYGRGYYDRGYYDRYPGYGDYYGGYRGYDGYHDYGY